MCNPAEDKRYEEEIFEYDRIDNGIMSSVITSDSMALRGRPTNEEILCRQNGILLRDHLRFSLHSHNMQRPIN